MACFFAPAMRPMLPMGFAPPVYYRRAAPCVNPLALLLVLVVAPTLVRVAFCILATAAHLLCFGAPLCLALWLSTALVGDCCPADELDAKRRAPTAADPSDCAGVRRAACVATCFAKMKAAAEACPCGPSAGRGRACEPTKTAEPATEIRRRDLSSARLEETADGVRVTVAAPGVKPDDLEVTVIEQTLRITGETAINGDVFHVDRHVVLASRLDPESAACTHADGVVTVTLTRKPSKVIRVNAASTPVAAEHAEGVPVVDENESSEGEWVEKEPAVKKDE